MKNLYEILGVSIQATSQDIKKAYKALSLRYHPDKRAPTTDEETAKKKYQEIVEAYAELSNPLKKETYDRLFKLKQMGHNTPRQPVAGLLTDPTPPLSSLFKNLHAKTCVQARMPLGLPPLKKSDDPFIPFIREGESVDFFHQLRDQASMPQDPLVELIDFKKRSLTPSHAFVLLANFLKGDYVGFNQVSLKHYFEAAIKSTGKSPDTARMLDLYQGILTLFKVADSDQNRKLMYSSMKKIIDYALYQEPTEDHIPCESMAEIFQLPAFRQLFSVGMQQQWTTPLHIPIERFLSSEVDKGLEEDNNGQKPLYLYKLYAAQNDLKTQCKASESESEKSESEKLRSLAYYCLDYIHVINATTLVAMNQVLQAAVLLKKASELEKDSSLQFSDETLIIQLSVLAKQLGDDSTPFSDFYAHYHSLRLLSNLKFQHEGLDILSGIFKRRLFKLMDFFPCTQELQSNLDLVNTASSQIVYLRNYLYALMGWCQDNVGKEPNNQKQLTLKRVDILYQAYEASLKNWYSEEFNPEVEQALRIELMEEFLREQGASFWDISKNVDSNFNMVERDEQGWLKPSVVLPFLPNMPTYQSMEGVDFDLNTGEIRFALKKWTDQDASYKKSFSHYDIMQIMRVMGAKDGKHSFNFSLDPIDSKSRYHPFQEMVYSPQSLEKTEFLFTLFLTDYLLKMFTTGYEVKGRYPYEVRSIDSLIAHLPPHLKKMIADFKKHPKSGQVHRFWIEASILPTLKESSESSISFSFGNIRMALKKHKMESDREGKLIDSDDECEGWPMYCVQDLKAFEKEMTLKDFNFRALVFIKNTDDIYIVEDRKIAKFLLTIPMTSVLKEEFLLQEFDATGKMIKPTAHALQDNDHFVYQLVNHVCLHAKRPTYFSPQRVFAEEFTRYYDELCQYFPEFERLKQLSRVTGAVKEMDRVFLINNQQLEANQTQLQDTEFWKAQEQAVCQKIEIKQSARFLEIFNKIQSDYATHLASLSTELQTMRNDMGSFTYHAGSFEITQFAQSRYNDIQKDFVAKHGQASWNQISNTVWPDHITPQIPNWVNQLNAQGATQRANYRQQVVTLFAKTSAFLGAVEFNKRVDAFMNGQTHSLAQGVAEGAKQASIKSIENQLKATFPYASQSGITSTLNGSPQALAQVVAKQSASEAVVEAKAELQLSIKKNLLLQANFKRLGFGLDSQSCEKRLPWIPASYYHEVDSESSSLVYGGVKVEPTLLCTLEANRHSLNLSRPSVSAFSSRYDIKNAESFVRVLQSAVSQASYKAETSSVYRVIQDMQNKISQAEREIRKADSFKSSTPDYGFRHRGIKDTPIYQSLMQGDVGGAGYQIFPSDSVQCAVLKSEINAAYAPGLDDTLHIPTLIRIAATVESLAQSIETHCKPATPEDLSESKRSFEDKWFFELTPQDFLNHYEKLRSEEKQYRKAQSSVPHEFKDKPPMWIPPRRGR